MPVKKGMSMEEKITLVEAYMLEHPQPFLMKELTTLIPKAKGVIWQSVEECIEVLVSENRVQSEKVGIHVLFWAFSATKSTQLLQQEKTLEEKLALTTAQLAIKKAELNHITLKRHQQEEDKGGGTLQPLVASRDELQRQLEALRGERKALEGRVLELADSDPAALDAAAKATADALEAANRWTDNVFLLQDFAKSKIGISPKEFREQFGLPGNLDYLD